MAKLADARAWVATHRVQSPALGLAAVGLGAFVALGLHARKQGEPLRTELAALQSAQAEVSTFRTAFSSSSPEHDLRIAQLVDSLSFAVPREQRVALARQIAAEAEAVGLADVRVRFATPDSAAAPERPALLRSPVATADYSIAIECHGGLASVLSLVNRLPTSVAVQRIVGTDVNGRSRFHLALAVFETSPAPALASFSGASLTPRLSHLAPFAGSVSDSMPVVSPAEIVALRRDPFAARPLPPAVKLAGATMDTTTRAKISEPKWHVSAILIGGAQRAAIINDVLVRVGDTLPGGTKLTSVEQDRVVLTESNGTAHTVAVREGEG